MSPSLRRTHWPSFRSMAGKRIISSVLLLRGPSRLPAQEIGNQGKAQRLALFRVELRPDHVVAPDKGRHRPAVTGGGDDVRGVFCRQMIRVDEIGVQSVRPGGNEVGRAACRERECQYE